MEKLTYNEFKEAIKDYFSKRMDHAEIQLTTNDTVNQKIDYLAIREKDATVSPSIRLNDSYKQYLDCKWSLFSKLFMNRWLMRLQKIGYHLKI